MSSSWDPALYLRFEDERLRPALDLMARIPHAAPRLVVDLGCGAGNALPPLASRFPGATVTGVDGSASMLAKAAGNGFATEQADIASWQPRAMPDVIFSNAALHWLPDHAALFPRLVGLLPKGGVLAVQMPAMHGQPLRAVQDVVAADGPWAERLSQIRSAAPILEPDGYYDLLRPLVSGLDLWVTEYLHVLRGAPDGVHPVAQWAMGTSLRPYLDALADTPDLQAGFTAAYSATMQHYYPQRPDGTALLPFRRQFIMAVV